MAKLRKKIWMFKIGEKLDLEMVKTLMAKAHEDIVQEAHPEGSYGIIERVDISKKETKILITADERMAKVFSRTLSEHVPKRKVTFSEGSQTDITALRQE